MVAESLKDWFSFSTQSTCIYHPCECLQESSYPYWPTHDMLEFGGYTIELLEDEKLQGFTIRKLSVLENKACQFVYVQELNMHSRFIL